MRVRIYTTIRTLVVLPWRLAAWKGKFLADSGWTFEVVTDIPPGPALSFAVPAPLLVIAPELAGMEDIGTREHVQALQQALPAQYGTSTSFRVARTREQIREAFLGMQPRVVYYYGHAENRGGQTCMLLRMAGVCRWRNRGWKSLRR